MNLAACSPEIGGASEDMFGKWSGPSLSDLLGEKLSRNDMVQITFADDEVLSGTYVVSRDGDLKLPYLPPVRAQGRSTNEVETALADALVAAEFYTSRPRLAVRITDFASVSVSIDVVGAVFEPHAVEIGGTTGDAMDTGRQQALGASTDERNLSTAIRAAGVVRPDADLSAVELHRQRSVYLLDLRGVFNGSDPTDIMMLTGDRIVVNSRMCFQDELMRSSPISPPGVSMFLSNLTQPVTSNAISAIGHRPSAIGHRPSAIGHRPRRARDALRDAFHASGDRQQLRRRLEDFERQSQRGTILAQPGHRHLGGDRAQYRRSPA
ncbi:Polysaccharide biosynthesis/export protein [Roseivivax halotolerans]|uniref:Polysaccharide biosynthesis/export protein n=1 Tax=Roseivivax halotolerans TaxID=93684 RepID=A0A1I6ALZ4_9RHOB|nr:Polysaccharide biosynthesis/export protein [Roseivivax halotolerans]